MKCRLFREKYELLQTDALGEEEKALLSEHLRLCDECRSFVDEAEKVGHLLREFVEESVQRIPEGSVVTRVRAGMREEREKTAFRRLWKYLVPAVAGVVALLFLMFYPSMEGVKTARFSYNVTVESVEAVNATVVLVDKGENSPKVIWIIEREET